QPGNFVSSGLFVGSGVPAILQFGPGLDITMPGGTAVTPVGAGNDILVGGRGNDTLVGHDGADHFVFDAQPGIENVDLIAASPGASTGFVSGLDRLDFDADIFTALGAPGAFSGDDARFLAGAGEISARDGDDRLVYDTSTGQFFY